MPLVSYDGDLSGYPDWLRAQLDTYNVPRNQLRVHLSCSDAWIRTIMRDVPYIKILRPMQTLKFFGDDPVVQAVIEPESSIYFHAEYVAQFLMRGQFTQQTKVVPAIQAFQGDLDAVEMYQKLELLQQLARESHCMPDLKKRNEDMFRFLQGVCPDAAISEYDRAAVEPITVAPFDWFNAPKKAGYWLAANTSGYRNRETLYRAMFQHGAIKITFGGNKTYFFVPSYPDESPTITVKATFLS